MKKFLIILSFSLMLVTACQVPNQTETASQNEIATAIATEPETELILLYYCDGMIQDTCYKDLKTSWAEISIPTNGYGFINLYSPEKVLVNDYIYTNDQASMEYYFFDTKMKALDCITCKLNSISYKVLSPSLQKVAMYQDKNLTIADLSKPDETMAQVSGSDYISQLSWSPDESFVIFLDGATRLYRLNLKDGSLVELLNKPSAIQIFYPEISPAGDKLAFFLLDENNDLYLAAMSVDETDFDVLADLTPKTMKISSSENTLISFAWSPTGDRIAFTAYVEDETDSLFTLNLDDTEPVLIDSSPIEKWSLAWSPDGSLIAFVGAKNNEQDIWTIAPDGTNLINQTNTPERSEFGPSWKR